MRTLLRRIGGHFREKQYAYVCVMITLGLLALGLFRFPNAIGRLVESCRDFGLSVAYVFCDWFDIEPNFAMTINDYPDYSFLNVKELLLSLFETSDMPSIPSIPGTPGTPSVPSTPSTPSPPIPSDWEIFKAKWSAYWQAFIDTDNIMLYLLYLVYYITLLVPILMLVMSRILCKHLVNFFAN